MKQEIYEPSLEPEILREGRKLGHVLVNAGILPEGAPRIGGAPAFDVQRIDALIQGSIDNHIHPAPDPFQARIGDQVDIAIDACQAGMRGLLFKTHYVPTAGTAPLVQKVVNQWASQNGKNGLDVFGGVVLNYCVGGLNPEAVVVNARIGGRVVWPPNYDSRHYHMIAGIPGGIELLDDNDRVVPAMKEILALIAEGDLVLAMSCLAVRDVFCLIDEAKRMGVKRMNVIHPNNRTSLMTVEQMKTAADKGAYIELTSGKFYPTIQFSWDGFMEAYRTVGAERLIAASDSGIFDGFPPLASFRHLVAGMLTHGIPDKDVERMIKKNPADLLYR